MTDDFAARQRAAQERLEAFERSQKEKKEKKQQEALQKHWEKIQQKREETQKEVQSFQDSFGSSMFENVDPSDLVAEEESSSSLDASATADILKDDKQQEEAKPAAAETADDFETRQRAARERVEAFEKSQKEKKKQKDSEALQAHLDGIQQRQMEAMKEVEAFHDSHSSMLEMLDPSELMMEEEDETQEGTFATTTPTPKNDKPSRTKSLKQEKQEALQARLDKEEAERRARLAAITSQKERNRLERERNRERIREQQRLEQQRAAEQTIQASRASMVELARIAKEQQERLMALQTRKPVPDAAQPTEAEVDVASVIRRPKRHSTYIDIKDNDDSGGKLPAGANNNVAEDLDHMSAKYLQQQQALSEYQQRLKDAVEDVPDLMQAEGIDEFEKFNSNHNSLRNSTYANLKKRTAQKDKAEQLSLNYFLTLAFDDDDDDDHEDGACNAKAKEVAIQAFQQQMADHGLEDMDISWDIENIKEFQKFIADNATINASKRQQDYYLDGFDPTLYSTTSDREIAWKDYKQEMSAQGIELDVDLEGVEEFHQFKSKGGEPGRQDSSSIIDTSRGRQQHGDWDFAEAVREFQKSRSSTSSSKVPAPSTSKTTSKERRKTMSSAQQRRQKTSTSKDRRRHSSYGTAPDMDWSMGGGSGGGGSERRGRSRLHDSSDEQQETIMEEDDSSTRSKSRSGRRSRSNRLQDTSSEEQQQETIMEEDESSRSKSSMNNSSKRHSTTRIPDRRRLRRQRSSSLSAMDRGGLRRVKTMEPKVPATGTKEKEDDNDGKDNNKEEKPSYNWTAPDFNWSTFQNDGDKKKKEVKRNKTSELEQMKSRGRRATTMGIPKRGLTRQRSSSLSDMKRAGSRDRRASTKESRRSMRKSRSSDDATEEAEEEEEQESSTTRTPKRGVARQRSSSLSAMKRSKDRSSKEEEKSRSPSRRRSTRKFRTTDDKEEENSGPTPKRGVARQRSSSLSDMKRGKDRTSREEKARSPSKRKSMRKSRTFDTTAEDDKSTSKDKDRSPSKRRSIRRSKTLETPIELDNSSFKDESPIPSKKRGSMRRSKTFDKAPVVKESSLSPPTSPKSSPPRRGITRQLSSSLSELRYERDRDSSISKRGSVSVRGGRSRTRDDKEKHDSTKKSPTSKRASTRGRRSSAQEKDDKQTDKENNKKNSSPPKRRLTRQRSSSLSELRTNRKDRSASKRKSRTSVLASSETKDGESPHAFYNWINHSKDAISRLESKKAAMEERRKKKKQQRKDQRTEQTLQQMSQDYELKMSQMKDALEQAHMEQLTNIKLELVGQLDELKGALAEQRRWREEDEARRKEEEARLAREALREADMAISDDSLGDFAFSEDDIMDSSGEDMTMEEEKSDAKLNDDAANDKGVLADKKETVDDVSASMDSKGDSTEQPADKESASTTGSKPQADDSLITREKNAIVEDCPPESSNEEAVLKEKSDDVPDGEVSTAEDENALAKAASTEEDAATQQISSSKDDSATDIIVSNASTSGQTDLTKENTTNEKAVPEPDAPTSEVSTETRKEVEAESDHDDSTEISADDHTAKEEAEAEPDTNVTDASAETGKEVEAALDSAVVDTQEPIRSGASAKTGKEVAAESDLAADDAPPKVATENTLPSHANDVSSVAETMNKEETAPDTPVDEAITEDNEGDPVNVDSPSPPGATQEDDLPEKEKTGTTSKVPTEAQVKAAGPVPSTDNLTAKEAKQGMANQERPGKGSAAAKKKPTKQVPPKTNTTSGAGKTQGVEPAGKKKPPVKTTQSAGGASSQAPTAKQAPPAKTKAIPKTKKPPVGKSPSAKQVAAGVKGTQPAKKTGPPADAIGSDMGKKKAATPPAKRTSLPTKKPPMNKDAPMGKKQATGNEKVDTVKAKKMVDKTAAEPPSSVKTDSTEDSTLEGSIGSKEDPVANKSDPGKDTGKSNRKAEKLASAKPGDKMAEGKAATAPRRASQVAKDKVKTAQKKPDAAPAKGSKQLSKSTIDASRPAKGHKQLSKSTLDASPPGAPMNDASEMSTSSRRRSGFLGKVVKGLMGRRGSLLGSSKQQKDDVDESTKKQAATNKQQKDDMYESTKKQAATKKAAPPTKQEKTTGKKVAAENKQLSKPSTAKPPLKGSAAKVGKQATPASKEIKTKNGPTGPKAAASKEVQKGKKIDGGPQPSKVGNKATGTKGDGSEGTNKKNTKSVNKAVPNPKAKEQATPKIMPVKDSNTSASVIPSDDELHDAGWAKNWDPDRNAYYYYRIDGEQTTTWENPLVQGSNIALEQSVTDLIRGKIREGLGPKPRAPKKKKMPAYTPPKPVAEEPEQEDYQDSPLRVLDTYEDELINEQLRAKIAKLEQQFKDTEEAEAQELAEVVRSGRAMYEKLSKQAETVSDLPDDLSELDDAKQKNDEIIKYLKAENERRRGENTQLKKTIFELHQNTGILEKETETTLGYLEKLEDVYYQGELDKRQRLLNTLRVFREAEELMSDDLARRSTHTEVEKRLHKVYDNYMAKLLIRTDKAGEGQDFVGLLCAISMGRHDDSLVERSTGEKQEAATPNEETKEESSTTDNDTIPTEGQVDDPATEETGSLPTVEEAEKDTAGRVVVQEPPSAAQDWAEVSAAPITDPPKGTSSTEETEPLRVLEKDPGE